MIDLHHLLRKRVLHRCKDGMHYDALIHREITTHIARYISCGWNRTTIIEPRKNEDHDLICYEVMKSMINQIDFQLTPLDKKIINECRPLLDSFDISENLNEKEKKILHLIDYYENHFVQ